jgi:carbamate kinase
MAPVASLARAGHKIVLTHGNGPIVGNILLRNEAARELVSPMPLHIAGADSQGGVGYMLRTALVNQLRLLDVERGVVALVTSVLIDIDDPAFSTPDKPIGPFYSTDTAARLAREQAWSFVDEPGRGSRRIVASPEPLEVLELREIAHLSELGTIVIAAGGGGIPTTRGANGLERGADAVVDKDRTSGLLGTQLNADALVIIMEEDAVYSDWGTPGQRELRTLSVADARSRLASGQFPRGSIAPKIEAGIAFTAGTGNPTLICSVESMSATILGRAGTRIVTD